jgi:hypothetical protein
MPVAAIKTAEQAAFSLRPAVKNGNFKLETV